MPWRVATSYPDYILQLSALLRDPVYRGKQVPKGTGQPVLLIPGFLAGDWTLQVMAGWLNRIGYRAYLSGIDWNVDCPDRTGEQLRWRLEYIRQETDQPLIVVGHSLGGMLARFLGANFPEHVQHVVAIGSPISTTARVHPLVEGTAQVLQSLRQLRGQPQPQCGVGCTCRFSESVFAALPEGVGFSAIYSKQDEIVHWQASMDSQGDNYEVSGRHIGLIVNRQVYHILAHSLSHASSCAQTQKTTHTQCR